LWPLISLRRRRKTTFLGPAPLSTQLPRARRLYEEVQCGLT